MFPAPFRVLALRALGLGLLALFIIPALPALASTVTLYDWGWENPLPQGTSHKIRGAFQFRFLDGSGARSFFTSANH